jgi:hypothetical protein
MEGLAEECGEVVFADVEIKNNKITKLLLKGENLSLITKKVIDKMKNFQGKNVEDITKEKDEILKEIGFGDVSAGKKPFALLPIKAIQRALEKK